MTERLRKRSRLICELSLLVAISSFAAACGTKGVDPEKIYAQYTLSYNGSGHTVLASATFTGGDALGPRVDINPSAITLSDGTTFHKEYTNPDRHIFYQAMETLPTTVDLSKVSYDFVLKDDQTYTNTLAFAGTIEPAANVSEISLSQQASVGWTSDQPLQDGEAVVVMLRLTSQGGGSITHQEVGTGNKGNASLGPKDLGPLRQGPGALIICRQMTGTPKQASKAGGTTTVTACSSEVAVTITP